MEHSEENYDLQVYLSDYAKTHPDKEVRIINAAINTFAEKGFEATRTKEIAQRAGIAEGTIFRYFPTKNAILERMVPLLIRVIQPKIGRPIEEILDLNQDAPVDRILAAVLKDRLQMIRDNGRFIRSVLPELIHRAPLLDQLRQSILPMIEGYVSQVVRMGKARGELDDSVDAKLMMMQMLGFVLAYSMTKGLNPEEEARDVEQFLQHSMQGWRKR
ncbi:MAG: TetR/AcrR family transcriptional regulator [Eubacteriales bacterium]|nr:TetR/AcrR family transcriptional regulator [Eubacteriales bacterium]